MKKSTSHMTIAELLKNNEKGLLDFDLAIQRKESIWDNKRASLFVNAVLSDFPIPALYAVKDNKLLSFVDGKQRLTTCFKFLKDEIKLHKDTPDIQKDDDTITLAGKVFSELPEELRNHFYDFKFEVIKVEEITPEEIKQLFWGLNNGVPLKKIEQTRVLLSGATLKFVRKIAESPFFMQKVNISESAKKRYIDDEVILQTLSLINNNFGFTSKELQSFVKELKDTHLRSALKAKMDNSCYFLNEIYLKKEKFLKKVNLPIIFKLAYDTKFYNWDISAKDFYDWSACFFASVPEEYKQASIAGSAKKDNVFKRYYLLSSDFEKAFPDIIPSGFYSNTTKESVKETHCITQDEDEAEDKNEDLKQVEVNEAINQ